MPIHWISFHVFNHFISSSYSFSSIQFQFNALQTRMMSITIQLATLSVELVSVIVAEWRHIVSRTLVTNDSAYFYTKTLLKPTLINIENKMKWNWIETVVCIKLVDLLVILQRYDIQWLDSIVVFSGTLLKDSSRLLWVKGILRDFACWCVPCAIAKRSYCWRVSRAPIYLWQTCVS